MTSRPLGEEARGPAGADHAAADQRRRGGQRRQRSPRLPGRASRAPRPGPRTRAPIEADDLARRARRAAPLVASTPRSRKRLSSSPTRTLPPSEHRHGRPWASACGRSRRRRRPRPAGSWWTHAPSASRVVRRAVGDAHAELEQAGSSISPSSISCLHEARGGRCRRPRAPAARRAPGSLRAMPRSMSGVLTSRSRRRRRNSSCRSRACRSRAAARRHGRGAPSAPTMSVPRPGRRRRPSPPSTRSPPMPAVRLMTTSMPAARIALDHLAVEREVARRLAGLRVAHVDVGDRRTGLARPRSRRRRSAPA